MAPPGFAIRVTVDPADIDDLGHANNVHYLRWMLEAATAHWAWYQERAPVDAVAGVGWVVLRHELDYFAPSFPGQELEILTWVPSCTALTCDRFYEVRRAADGALLARGASSYCVVDLVTGKPRRMGEPLRQAIGAPDIVKRTRPDRLFPEPPSEVLRGPPR
ncbi:MAG: acyl-CoA thioesterase [Gemmatimonadales bacterium]